MAEIRNNFIRSKMNKDLDARLVPSGEYRDALNVAVSKSEGDDVGALENILGNLSLTNFGLSADEANVDIIGTYMDLTNDRIFVFMTNYVDTSVDKLSNFASANASCYIGVYNTSTLTSSLLVSGHFLNFSKTHSVLGVNLIDDLLFWTDNRNQPRKINVTSALANSSYYTTEDQISVAKYYPFSSIDLYRKEVVAITLHDPGVNYTVKNNYETTSGGSGSGLTVNVTNVGPGSPAPISAVTIGNSIGQGYSDGDIVDLIERSGGSGGKVQLSVEYVSTMRDVTSPTLPDGSTTNPYYDANWPGDPEFLKDKFFRFAYRFKFDDGEYSLISPFTQECFVPEQDGYFIGDDEEQSFKSTEVGFVENKIDSIGLVLNVPGGVTNWSDVATALKVEEIQIISKQASETSLRIIDTITSSTFSQVEHPQLLHDYQSRKPWKTLPSSALLRVYDQAPVRALAQEVGGNRVIYGNFVDKHTPPETLQYQLAASQKLIEDPAPGSAVEDGYSRKEYQNHTLKQNRTYQVGIVLSDRYGRQSDVILSAIDKTSASTTLKGSTIFHGYKTGDNTKTQVTDFSYYPGGTDDLLSASDTWPGDSLQITFNDIIESVKNTSLGTPGLYSATNPTGWYSYKVVVKQTEQDYYNVYFPGLLNGYIDGESENPLAASVSEPVCHFSLAGDNLNKIPRDLSLVGPTQNFFRTGRPSPADDPSYYEFTDPNGVKFFADPYTEEGEQLLKTRDRIRDLDSGSQITNAAVDLYARVLNYASGASGALNAQYYPGTNKDTVVTIGTGTELGLWSPSAKSPYNTAPVFYGYENNPYIAKVMANPPVAAQITGYGVVGPSPNAANLEYGITLNAVGSAEYIAGSKNISTVPTFSGGVAYNGSANGVLVDIDQTSTGSTVGDQGTLTANGTSISNEDGEGIKGFTVAGSPYILKVLQGADDGQVEMAVTERKWGAATNMSPIFSVYETTPIESKLDIYWETTTAGLISTLNTNIQANDTHSPYGFELKTVGTPVVYTQYESNALNTDLTEYFVPNNSVGTAILNENTNMAIDSVIDGYGNERKGEFNLLADGTGAYKIRNSAYFYYGSKAPTLENYTFYIRTTVPSATYAADFTTITRTVELNSSTLGGCFLRNVAPTISIDSIGPNAAWPAGVGCGNTLNLTDVAKEDQLAAIFSAVNGANTNDTRKTNDLTYTITGGGTSFYLQTVPNEPWKTQLYADGGTPIGSTAVDITVTDAGGISQTCSLTLAVES